MKKRTHVKKSKKSKAKVVKSAKPRVRRTRRAAGEAVLSKPQIVKAAIRFYEKDHRQQDIAKGHKISSSYLARLLIKSRKEGVFKVKVFGSTGAVQTAPKKAPKKRARRPSKRK